MLIMYILKLSDVLTRFNAYTRQCNLVKLILLLSKLKRSGLQRYFKQDTLLHSTHLIIRSVLRGGERDRTPLERQKC